MRKSLVALLAVVVVGFLPCTAKEKVPLKVIAPDLVIESVEQGQFLDDPADPRHFRQTNVVPHRNRYLFGWRMKLKTTRKSILVQAKGVGRGQPNALPMQRTPKYGYIFAATDIVDGVSPGKYTSILFVENVPVKTLTMVVK